MIGCVPSLLDLDIYILCFVLEAYGANLPAIYNDYEDVCQDFDATCGNLHVDIPVLYKYLFLRKFTVRVTMIRHEDSNCSDLNNVNDMVVDGSGTVKIRESGEKKGKEKGRKRKTKAAKMENGIKKRKDEDEAEGM